MAKHPFRIAFVVLGVLLAALGIVLLVIVGELGLRVVATLVFFAGLGCVMFALGKPGRESLKRHQDRDWKK